MEADFSTSATSDSWHRLRILIHLCFTMILLGYFMVWLPQRVAGLSFIGIEMGEWVKFISEVRTGEVTASRNFFYLPPVTLGAMIAIWTAGWTNSSWKTWATRFLAVTVGLLAFPALESLLNEAVDQWLSRIIMITFVVGAVALAAVYSRRSTLPRTVPWLYFVILGLAAAFLPLWTYLEVRPLIEQLFRTDIGLGPGVWLNLVGNLVLVLISLFFLAKGKKSSSQLG